MPKLNPVAWVRALQRNRTASLHAVSVARLYPRPKRRAYRDPSKRRKLNRQRRREEAGL